MKSNMQLSIIIVEYKSGEYLKRLLKQLPKRKDWEVIVVDNNTENRGYGGGINYGVTRAHGIHLLFLNPDVLIDENAISTLVKYLEKHKHVGIVGPKFINAERKTEQCSTQFPSLLSGVVALSPINSLFPNNPISKKFWIKDWNRESTRKVDVISGAAMMVRTSEFKKIGLFDQRMFLYWEEFDLCARYKKELGLDAVCVAEAVAQHPREVSMKQSDVRVHSYFVESRRVYLKKHVGLLATLLIEVWLGLCEKWRYVGVGVLAFFLRIWDIQHIQFIGDLGRDYLEATRIVELKSLPIMGIPSSIPRFMQGPFNIWFDAVSFALGGMHPFSPVIFSAVLTTIGVLFLMRFASQHFGRNPGFVAGLLSATMVSGVLQSRMPFYLFAVPLFLVLYLYVVIQNQSSWKTLFFSVLTYWLAFQWEMALLPLLLPLAVVVYKANMQWKHKIFASSAATVLGLLPQIIFDITHACAQLCGLGIWAVYRVFAFTGFDGKHGVAALSFVDLYQQISSQLHKLLGLDVWSGVFLIALCIGTALLLRKKTSMLAKYAFFSSLVLLAAIIIHGSPSEAYFPPFLVFIPLMIAFILSFLSVKQQKIVVLCVLIGVGFTSYSLISLRFYAKPIRNMLDAAQWIVQDAQANPVYLYSYDEPAHQNTYLDHMQFLIHIYGGSVAQRGYPYIVSLDKHIGLPTINIIQQEFGEVRIVKRLSTQ